MWFNFFIRGFILLTADKTYIGDALLTYPSPDVLEVDRDGYMHLYEYAEIGDSKRLLCEGFVGEIFYFFFILLWMRLEKISQHWIL